MGDGEGALSDAYKCRMLRPDWAKGCYRQGAAHMLLGVRYTLLACQYFYPLWGVSILCAWICYVLGAQASPWRSSGHAEVGSWKWRDWERTTVTCYPFVYSFVHVQQWQAVSMYVKWQQDEAIYIWTIFFPMFLFAIVSIIADCLCDCGWNLFLGFGFCRKAMELMKVSHDEDEQWSVAIRLRAACGGKRRIVIKVLVIMLS